MRRVFKEKRADKLYQGKTSGLLLRHIDLHVITFHIFWQSGNPLVQPVSPGLSTLNWTNS